MRTENIFSPASIRQLGAFVGVVAACIWCCQPFSGSRRRHFSTPTSGFRQNSTPHPAWTLEDWLCLSLKTNTGFWRESRRASNRACRLSCSILRFCPRGLVECHTLDLSRPPPPSVGLKKSLTASARAREVFDLQIIFSSCLSPNCYRSSRLMA